MVAANASKSRYVLRHGYTAFSAGSCSCDECRLAGRNYRRQQRAKRLAWLQANPNHSSHGLRASYDCGCRCRPCVDGRRDAPRWRRPSS